MQEGDASQLPGRALELPFRNVERAGSGAGGPPFESRLEGPDDEPFDGLAVAGRVVGTEAEIRLSNRGVIPPLRREPRELGIVGERWYGADNLLTDQARALSP